MVDNLVNSLCAFLYLPVEEENGPYASNEVDVTATIGGNIGSATGTHYLTLKTGDSWSGDTYY